MGDAGKTWERVGLSPRLPGIPVLITATGDDGVAEMVTDQGAIYLTTDAARNWKAAVEVRRITPGRFPRFPETRIPGSISVYPPEGTFTCRGLQDKRIGNRITDRPREESNPWVGEKTAACGS